MAQLKQPMRSSNDYCHFVFLASYFESDRLVDLSTDAPLSLESESRDFLGHQPKGIF